MNKREVAERLGISTRQVENYASQGRLGEIKYVRGKTGKAASFDGSEVERLKRELDTPDLPVTTLQAANSHDAGHSGLVRRNDVAAFFDQLTAVIERRDIQPQINIGEKIMLTLTDAATLASLSTNHLREAIKAGNLKARIIGRGWKVKRTDLDSYVRKL
jgi:excisionase family DNA binding protein